MDIINSFLFHPRKAIEDITSKDILINIEKNIKIGARLHMVNNFSPTILFFHGNGEIVTDYNEIAKEYNRRKMNFIIVDFRGYGFSNGMPNMQNTLSDSHTILNFIIKYLLKNDFDG